jgi:general secretion pathway protein A
LRAVSTAFGLPAHGQDKARLLSELEAYLTSLVPKGTRALLIVDEAQNLPPQAIEELRMLSNFQIGNRALLQSFLVGQPELRGPDAQPAHAAAASAGHCVLPPRAPRCG